MTEIRNRFQVPFEYPVFFADDATAPDHPLLADLLWRDVQVAPVRSVVFMDSGLVDANPRLIPRIEAYFANHSGRIRLAAPVHRVPGGEACKQGLGAFEQCVDVLSSSALDRHSYVITFGGGAVLDCAGFAASCVHRGIRQIRFPTTVLGQNDAGIGVKNGVDHAGQKNFLGTFFPPDAVVNDFALLSTLPREGWRDGLSEAVKVALIRDGVFFDWMDSDADALGRRDPEAMRWMIRRCAELHLAQITQGGDPFERGSARPLDFGHWAAHKLEQLSNFRITHGHAVAVGIAIDTTYSAAAGMLPEASAMRVLDVLGRLGFDLDVAALAGLTSRQDLPRLIEGVAEFQQHLGGRLALTMLSALGTGVEIDQVDLDLLSSCCGRVLFSSPV